MFYDTRAVLDLDEKLMSDEKLDEVIELLLSSIRATERDLGSKSLTLPNGIAMTPEQRRQWKNKACKSMDFRTEKYRKCKQERQRRRTQRYNAAIDQAATSTDTSAPTGR